MKEKKRSTGVWRGLTAIFASLMVVMIGGLQIADANATTINTRLGLSNYRTVDTSEEKVDSVYFKSEFTQLSEVVDAQNELAEEISEEGTVLLKNESSALPLDTSSESVTLWGQNSHDPVLGGMIGSSVALADGQTAWTLEAALAEKGFTLNQDMISLYTETAETYARTLVPSFGTMYADADVYGTGEAPASVYTDSVLSSADDTVALVVISRGSSEAADYTVGMVDPTGTDSYERPLALSDNEKDMIDLAKQHSTKVVVLLNCSNPVEIGSLKKDDGIDAIVWVGDPGANGFLGVADVLSGEVNPSGHLTDTYAANTASAPSMVNYGVTMYTNNSQNGTGDVLSEDDKADWYIVESEGIYNGYKYYETRYEDQVLGQGNATSSGGAFMGDSWNYADEMVYPFGYGISYTTFEQKLDSVECVIGETGKAKVKVTNTGNAAGKCAVQLYVQAPYTQGGLEKSAIQFVAFGKTDVLDPGQSQDVEIEFDPSYFASYDESVTKDNGTEGAWVLEKGTYYFTVANGAHEAINNVLAKKTGSTSGLVKTSDEEVIDADNVKEWELVEDDTETYSENVENRLQDADLNKLIEGSVEYTTRSDWSKGWTKIEDVTPTDAMMVGLKNQLYEFTENDGDGSEIVWGADTDLNFMEPIELDEDGEYVGVAGLDDPIWDELLDQITLDEALSFLEKGGDDVENIDSIGLPRNYGNDGPIGFAFDQVPGYASRWTSDKSDQPTYVSGSEAESGYSMAVMPTEPVVAATMNPELVKREGELFGESALWSNEGSIFAPGANLHRSAYCARNHEYYSEDSMLTGLMADYACQGGKEKGLMMEPKHFAFNHQEENRSGLSTFISEQGGRENELRCFELCMSNNDAQGIMTAFNRIGTAYAGGYSPTLMGIARDEWGYEGWYNTDMINGADYMNWRDVIANGGGSCLTSTAYDASNIGDILNSKSEIEKDGYFQQMVKYNIKYWLYNIDQSIVINGLTSSMETQYVLVWWQYAIYAAIAVFGILAVLTAVLGFWTKFRKPKAQG